MHKKLIHCILFLFAILGFPFLLSAFVLAKKPADSKTDTQPAHFSFSKAPATLKQAPAIITADDPVEPITICSGSSTSLSGKKDYPIPPDTYSWEVQQGSTWINAPGTNNLANYEATFLINNSNANVIYNLRRRITFPSSAGFSYDSYKLVTVQPATPISNNAISAPTTSFCTSSTPTNIVGTTPTGGNGTYTYQWQSSTDNVTFTDIAGATGKDFSAPQLTVTTYYRRTASASSCIPPSPSNTIAIVIADALSNNSITAPAPSSFCLNGDPSIITGSIPAGGGGTYSYQWQSSTDNVTFTDIPAATTKDYNPPVISTTTYYRRAVTSGSCTIPLISNTVTITILSTVANNVLTPPAVTTFCVSGDPAVITGSTPTGGSGTYTYQWQSSTDNATFTDISGAVGRDYNPSAINTTTYFRRIAVSGLCTTPLISNIITIAITPLPVTPVATQPIVTVCPGNRATLSVNAPQQGVTYNWYDSPSRTTVLFTGISYVTPVLSTAKTYYIESTNGQCSSATVSTVQVNIAATPTVPQVVNSQLSICNGSTALLAVANPQTGITYSWYPTATGGSALATNINFVTPALSTTTTYYVEAINTAGCTSASRTPVTVMVMPIPQVTVQGASICAGTSASLTATASIQNTTINWYTSTTGGSPLHTGSTFNTPVLNSATTYYVEAVNNTTSCASVTRQQVQVQMLQPLPAPVLSVANTTLSSVTFKWDAVNGATGYQISTDNGLNYMAPSSGSNGLTHTVTGLQANQPITIKVRATGSTDCETSSSTSATAEAVSQSDEIYVANAFTPNGDGTNDQVYVHSENIKTMNFYVYSQWGELLFTSTNPASGWDGTYKGTLQPVGVYIYYVKATMNNGREVNKKGTITLIK